MQKLFFITIALLLHIGISAQRDVILIIADDIGTDYFGFYADHQDTVGLPNIRKLLDKGILFTNAMSNPVCSATRCGILTGRYSFRTGVGGIVGGIGGSGEIDTSEMTIPKLLAIYNSNIKKADIGKWHLCNPAPPIKLQYPLLLGYNHYEGPFIGQLPSYTNWTKYTNGIASTITTYATTENVNNAISWKNAQGMNPTFLWLAFNAPHEPLHLPPAGLHSYTTLSGTAGNINAQPKEYFKAMLQALDHEVGRLFDSLRVMSRLDSTDIIFIGDNGNTQRTAQITDLTKAKGTVYQYGVHVPFIISGPSVVAPGRISDALVNTTDLFATILELFGDTTWQSHILVSKPVDSKSLLPIIKNISTSIRPWAFTEIFKLTTDSSDGKGIRNNDYKLIRFDYGKEEFYKLSVDPNESNNLLESSLSTTDITNYYYLCNELTNLVGSGTYCTTDVSIQQTFLQKNHFSIYPNPFTNTFLFNQDFLNTYMILYDALGHVIYEGSAIEKQDFSSISKGVYYLRWNDSNSIKIIKQ